MGAAGMILQGLPVMGNIIRPEEALNPGVDTAKKKQMADVALNAARSRGATYADVRLGRYLNQFTVTREDKVQNIVNTESYGMGIRVIANGSWGFAATDQLDNDSIAKAAAMAVSIAKENARLLKEPVQLAPQKGFGEVSWKTPIEKNGFEVPVKRKGRLTVRRKRCGDESRRQLYYFAAVPGERAEIFCIDRRVLYRPGYSSHLARIFHYQDRCCYWQVRNPQLIERTFGHGVGVSCCQACRQNQKRNYPVSQQL